MIAPPAFDPWVAALGSRSGVSQGGIDRSAKQAAQQFEALLIRQFLSNARSTSWLSDQQESESGWREIADDSLAGYLVKAGGLGLTKQVESLIAQAQRSRTSLEDSKALAVPRSQSAVDALNLSRDSAVKSMMRPGAAMMGASDI
jgi:Rod binding domain-containing protein